MHEISPASPCVCVDSAESSVVRRGSLTSIECRGRQGCCAVWQDVLNGCSVRALVPLTISTSHRKRKENKKKGGWLGNKRTSPSGDYTITSLRRRLAGPRADWLGPKSAQVGQCELHADWLRVRAVSPERVRTCLNVSKSISIIISIIDRGEGGVLPL